jgi:hypothetical protein
MLLQVLKRHIEQLHGLIEARVDLHLLAEMCALDKAGVEAAHEMASG